MEEKKGFIKFDDRFHASIAVATQLNKAFVMVKDNTIEKDILKNAVAPKTLRHEKKEFIIFPYYYDTNGNLKTYTEKEFENKFPLAFSHLSEYKDQLIKKRC